LHALIVAHNFYEPIQEEDIHLKVIERLPSPLEKRGGKTFPVSLGREGGKTGLMTMQLKVNAGKSGLVPV